MSLSDWKGRAGSCGCGRRHCAYRARAWDEAEAQLLDLQRMNAACGLYKMYLQRIELMRRHPPPPDWDGVSVFDEK
jgi:adenylate cyclase